MFFFFFPCDPSDVCLLFSLVQHFPVCVEENFIPCVTEAKDGKSGLTTFFLIAHLSVYHIDILTIRIRISVGFIICTLIICPGS